MNLYRALAVSVVSLLGIGEASPREGIQEFTPASKAAIHKGVKWLLSIQNGDGGFGVDAQCGSDVCSSAVAGLALLAAGSTPTSGEHSRSVNRVLGYLLKRVEASPIINMKFETATQVQSKIGEKVHSFFAALFLSQVMGEAKEKERVKKALVKVVRSVEQAQESDGSWGMGSWAPALGTVTGWSALRGAHFAGIEVKASMQKVERHLLDQLGAPVGGWMHELYKNAAGVRVLYAIGKDRHPTTQRTIKKVVELVTRDDTAFTMAGGEEYLAFHYLTECMLQARGKAWSQWFPVVRDKLAKTQNRDGTWSGHHCITSRTFCTAMALLTLQAPNRLLPISQQ